MNAASPIRILLADDHFLVRMGIKAVINEDPDLVVVCEAANGHDAVKAVREHCPDIVLMDLRMPEGSGLEATTAICREFASTRVIMLTTYDGDEDIYRALQAGAVGYLLKDTPGDEMLNAIHRVHGGARHLPPAVARRLAERDPHSDLSPKQLEVLELMAKGLTNQEIAEVLGTTRNTARSHVSAILAKLEVEDRTEATFVAYARGIIHLG